MLLCISANPAIDQTLSIPGFSTGKVHRAHSELISAGGKGLNAARAARVLGYEALCMGLLGGHHGRLLAELVSNEGLPSQFTWLAKGETRTCSIVLDDGGGEATVINTLGPEISEDDWERLASDIVEYARVNTAALFAGSLPPHAPLQRYPALFAALRQAGCQTWVDAGGATLHAALKHPPDGIKVNGAEIGQVLGVKVENFDEALIATRKMHTAGVRLACITLGKTGAVLSSQGDAWLGIPPPVAAVSNVGSGDSFLAALAAGLLESQPAPEALCSALAAGAANTLTPIPGQFSIDDFHRLRRLVQVMPA